MSKIQEDTVIGYHVVCLIDVLGQKQKLAGWAKLPDDGQPTPEFNKAFDDTAGTVLRFRNLFIQFFNQLGQSQCTIPDKLAKLSTEQQAKYPRCKECSVKVERFSDTFVFSSLIPNTHGDASITPLYRILATCCMAMLGSLADKTPIRGAISIGPGAALEDGRFYGPGLAEVHTLESKVAEYPRVVVSSKFHGFLSDEQAYSHDRDVDQAMKRLANTCRSLIFQDVDGCWIVDFCGKGMRNLPGPDTQRSHAVSMAYDFVQSEADRFRQEGDSKLALRYHLLHQYMESRLSLWE